MLGRRPDELPGIPITDLTTEGARGEVERKLGHLHEESAEASDVCFRRADGTDLWAIVSSSPVSDDDGALVGTLLMVTASGSSTTSASA